MRLLLDFGGTDVKMALVDDHGVSRRASIPTASLKDNWQSAADLVKGALNPPAELEGVAIALPGVVDLNTGRLLHANDKYDFVTGIDLRQWGVQAFGAPTVVENDARVALIGEVARYNDEHEGQAPLENAVLVTLGTGIGTGALVDGRPVRGRNGHAGILGGHVTIDLDGAVCACGNVGCAEVVASTWALTETGRYPEGFKGLFDAAACGNVDALALVTTCVDAWGSVVVTMCHMYDPDVVFLTGGVLREGEMVSGPIREYVASHLWPSVRRPAIEIPPSPELSVIRGLDVLATKSSTTSEAGVIKR